MGLLSNQIAALFERARRCYEDAQACTDAKDKRRLVAMGDAFVQQAKQMQLRQERQLEGS
jgi:hypothetical protein